VLKNDIPIEAPPPSSDLVEKLAKFGIPQDLAEELVLAYPEAKVKAALQYAPLMRGLGEGYMAIVNYLRGGSHAGVRNYCLA
jgi:hypothetical protein